jgi:hypothetical protein
MPPGQLRDDGRRRLSPGPSLSGGLPTGGRYPSRWKERSAHRLGTWSGRAAGRGRMRSPGASELQQKAHPQLEVEPGPRSGVPFRTGSRLWRAQSPSGKTGPLSPSVLGPPRGHPTRRSPGAAHKRHPAVPAAVPAAVVRIMLSAELMLWRWRTTPRSSLTATILAASREPAGRPRESRPRARLRDRRPSSPRTRRSPPARSGPCGRRRSGPRCDARRRGGRWCSR